MPTTWRGRVLSLHTCPIAKEKKKLPPGFRASHEVDEVAIEVEDNFLTAHTVIGLATPMIDAISYMADLLGMLIWFNLLIIQGA